MSISLKNLISVLKIYIPHDTLEKIENTVNSESRIEKISEFSPSKRLLERTTGKSILEAETKAEIIHVVERKMSNFILNVNEKINQDNSCQNSPHAHTDLKAIMVHIECATEYFQENVEFYHEIQELSEELPRTEFHETLCRVSILDVNEHDEEFQARWKAFNLIMLNHLCMLVAQYKLVKKISKYCITWLTNAGKINDPEKIVGFLKHILAIIHGNLANHGDAALYFEAAKSAYISSNEKNWKYPNTKSYLKRLVEDGYKYTYNKSLKTEVTIGKNGGSMTIDGCQVIIPKKSLTRDTRFSMTSSCPQTSTDEYVAITSTLECEPSTTFAGAVKVSIPTWCQPIAQKNIKIFGIPIPTWCLPKDESDIEVVCKCNDKPELVVLRRMPLKQANESISFNCQHFSYFFIRMKLSCLLSVQFSVDISVWKTDAGNFAFVVALKDKTVRKKTINDLIKKGYRSTDGLFNSIVLGSEDKLKVKMMCDNGSFDPPERENFQLKIRDTPVHKEGFALTDIGEKESSKMSCEISKNGEIITNQTWNEKTHQFKEPPRIEDVFLDEIVKEFSNQWRRFALSCHGLKLSLSEVEACEESFRASLERQKMAMLNVWKERTGGSDERLVRKIRKAVARFRKHLKRNQGNMDSIDSDEN